MLLPWWKNQNLLNPEEIWRLKIASMVIALGWNRRDRRELKGTSLEPNFFGSEKQIDLTIPSSHTTFFQPRKKGFHS